MENIELYNDNYQNWRRYLNCKAQLIIADVPYNLGNNAYASNPKWYVDGDNSNGESELAGQQFFDTDKDFRPAEFMHFCSRLLVKEPKEKGKAPCMIIFCAFEQMMYFIELGKRYGFNHYIPLVFRKNFSAQVLKANMKVVGNCEYGVILYRDKLPKFNNNGRMVFNCMDYPRDNKTPKIHPTQKSVPLLEKLITLFTDPGDVVIDPCVDAETEYFNGHKWVKISHYKSGDKVLIYDMRTGNASLEQPLDYLVQEYNKPFIRYSSYGIDIATTPDHAVVNISTTGKIRKTPMSKVFEDNQTKVNGFRGVVPLTFKLNGNEEDYNEWYLRLMVASQADGCRRKSHRTGKYFSTNRFVLKVVKERKARRMRYLLEKAGVDFHEYREEGTWNGKTKIYTCFSYISPYGTKIFNYKYLFAKDVYKSIILDEIKHWDGNIYGRNSYVRFNTSVLENANFIQLLAHSVGRSARLTADCRTDTPNYQVSFSNKKVAKLSKSDNFGKGQLNNMALEISEDNHCYCFRVSTGAFIVRRNGKIHITGNCAGSGTTLLAARNLGRRAYGFEIKKDFCEAARKLIADCHQPKDMFAIAEIEERKKAHSSKTEYQTSLFKDNDNV